MKICHIEHTCAIHQYGAKATEDVKGSNMNSAVFSLLLGDNLCSWLCHGKDAQALLGMHRMQLLAFLQDLKQDQFLCSVYIALCR